jgi:hypothetical protein
MHGNIFMCRLSRNLGASSSWNPQDMSRLVMGLIYLYLYPFLLEAEKDYYNENLL